MFSRNCPNCGKLVPWQKRKELLLVDTIHCVYCTKPLCLSFKYSFTNALIIGGATGLFLSRYTDLSIEFIVIIAVIAGEGLQRCLDVLFPLKIAKE